MGSHDVAVCCGCQSDSIYPSPGTNPQLCKWQKPSAPWHSLLCVLWLVWYRGLQLFLQIFTAHRPFYLTKRHQTLIYQSKGLYSTAQLPCLYAHAPWLTGAFWHCFASSTIVPWQQYWHKGQLHLLTVDVDKLFHNISLVVQWYLGQPAFWHISLWL